MTFRARWAVLGTMSALLLAACAAMPAAPARIGDTELGRALVDGNGMTLYYVDDDQPDKSTCYSLCARHWPPLVAMAGASATGAWAITPRDDGMPEWAYKDRPLYTYFKDAKPGDATGDGVGEIWHIARP